MGNKIYLRHEDLKQKFLELKQEGSAERFQFEYEGNTYYNLDSIIHIVTIRSYQKGLSKSNVKNIFKIGVLNFINILLGRRHKLNFILKESKELEKGIFDYCN